MTFWSKLITDLFLSMLAELPAADLRGLSHSLVKPDAHVVEIRAMLLRLANQRDGKYSRSTPGHADEGLCPVVNQ